MIWFTLIFTISISSRAITPLIECDYKTENVDLEFTLVSADELKLKGKILDLPIECLLKLEEVTDLNRARGPESFRVNSRRMDKNCTPEPSLAIKKGLEDQIDILIFKKSAKVFLFENYKPVTCQQFKFNEAQLKALSKLPKQKYRAEYSSRTTRPFDFLQSKGTPKSKP